MSHNEAAVVNISKANGAEPSPYFSHLYMEYNNALNRFFIYSHGDNVISGQNLIQLNLNPQFAACLVGLVILKKDAILTFQTYYLFFPYLDK